MKPLNASWLRSCLCAAGIFAAVLRAQDVTGEKPVELPTYTVTDTRTLPPPETWRYVSIPGFEVLSDVSEAKTRHVVSAFQRFCVALDMVWPGVQQPMPEPITFIVCGRKGHFQLFEPAGKSEAAVTKVTRVLREGSHLVIVLDLSTLTATDAGVPEMTLGVADAQDGDFQAMRDIGDRYRLLYREYVRYLLASAEPRAPAWFEEGLAQIFMSMQILDKSITVGNLEDPSETRDADGRPVPLQDLDFNAVLARARLMPMEEMFAMPHDAPATQAVLGSLWSKQCYAFVHWALYGNDGKNQKAFVTLMARLTKRPLTEQMFKDTFKKSYRDMIFELHAYVQSTDHIVAGVEGEKGAKLAWPPKFEVRDATEAEVGRIKGDAMVVAGNRNEARGVMMAAYIRGERDPQLLASIGLLEKSGGDEAKADKFITAAAQAKVNRPQVYLEVARKRFAEAQARPAGAAGAFSAQQIAAVLTPLFTARGQQPRLAGVYQLIADTWAKSGPAPEPDHLTVLNEGVVAFPRDAALVYATAMQKARAGVTADVAKLVEHGLKISAQDPEMQAKFAALQKK